MLGLPGEAVEKGLGAFTGAGRRFEYKGTFNGAEIYDDYAHHPREIAATLATAKNYPHRRLWCVFQPHTFTRTRAFMKEFAKALCLADHVILTDIYPARETDNLGISSKNLQDEVISQGGDCYYFSSFDEIQKFILEKCSTGDLLITMGAGNVAAIGDCLLKR